jgi:hypothetical protein
MPVLLRVGVVECRLTIAVVTLNRLILIPSAHFNTDFTTTSVANIVKFLSMYR